MKQTCVFTSTELVYERDAAMLLSRWNEVTMDDDTRKDLESWDSRGTLAKYLQRAAAIPVYDGVPSPAPRNSDRGMVSGVVVRYKRSSVAVDARVGGRMFAEDAASYQSMARGLRHTLARDLYHDVDIVNAHPQLLLQMRGRDVLPALADYVDARGERLAQLQKVHSEAGGAELTAEGAKHVVLSVLNGGEHAYESLSAHPEWLRKLHAEMAVEHARVAAEAGMEPTDSKLARAVGKVKAVPALRKLREVVEKTKSWNIGGSLLNHALCGEEEKVLNAAIQFLKLRRIPRDHVVLVFDGFMVPRGACTPDAAFLKALAEHVKGETGYALAFAEKKMDQGFSLAGLEPIIRPPTRLAKSDLEAATIVRETLDEHVRFVGPKRAFARTRAGIWCDHPNAVQGVLTRVVAESGIKQRDGKGVPRVFVSNDSHARAIVNQLRSDPPMDPSFLGKLRSTNEGKLFFEDGVYDFATGEVREETASDLPVMRIPRKFPRERNGELEGEVRRRIMTDVFGSDEVSDNMLQHLARALAGKHEDKQMVVVTGERNSGKGNLATMVENAFGPYVGTTHSDNFLHGGNSALGGDAAKKLSWVLGCEYQRIVFTQEFALDENNSRHRVDGNSLKRLVGGGDTISARRNHQDEQATFFDARLIMMCNQMPPVTPSDALESAHVVPTAFKFVSDAEYDARHETVPFMRRGDPSIKAWCRRDDVVDAFTRLVLDAYTPEKIVPCALVKEASIGLVRENVSRCAGRGGDPCEDEQDSCDGVGDEISVITSAFLVTRASADTVSSSEAMEAARALGLSMSSQKLKQRLIGIGGKESTNVIRDGRNKRGYLGLKLSDSACARVDAARARAGNTSTPQGSASGLLARSEPTGSDVSKISQWLEESTLE